MAFVHTINKQIVPAPTFALRHAYAGVHRLNPALTINGVTVLPTLRYKGGDATATQWPAWGYGETLAIAGAGTAPTLNTGSPLYGASDDSVRSNGDGSVAATGKSYAGSATLGNLGTDDVVVELIFEVAATTDYILGKGTIGEATAGKGWWVACISGALYFRIFAAAMTSASTALTAGSIVHAIGFGDRSGSFQWYVDGAAAGAAAAISTQAASVDNATAFNVFGFPNQQYNYTKRFMYVGIWQGAAWLDTHLQPTIAAARFAALMGGPTVAQGSAVPDVMTRSTPTYVYKVVSGVLVPYYVGANWPAMHSRVDSAGRTLVGVAPDIARTNYVKQSKTLNTTPWSPRGTCVVTEATAETEAPDGSMTANKIVGLKMNPTNDIFQTVAGLGAGSTLAPSMWIKRISTTGTLRIRGISGPGVWTVNMASLPDGWVRLTRGSPYVSVSVEWTADGAGGIYFVLDSAADTLSFYVWNVCVFTGLSEAANVADIVTTTAVVTRTVSNLRFPGLANLGGVGSEKQGAFRFKVLSTPAFTPPSAFALVGASDGGSAADSIAVTVGTDGYVDVASAATGGAAGASVGPNINVCDGAIHDIVVSWSTNRLTCWVDGIQGTVDSVVDIPDELDRLEVGQDCAGASQGGILIGDVKVFPRALQSPLIVGSGWR